MNTDYLKEAIRLQHQAEGTNMYGNNADYVMERLNASNDQIVPINLSQMERGKFYFVFYDLQGKSSKMEKFNPLFVIDWIDQDGTRFMYGVSINFIPVAIRVLFFNTVLNYGIKTIESNAGKTIDKQEAISGINFAGIYKMLYSIGFEWSIRRFDARLISKVCAVSFDILPKFITMSTAKMTGVDDGKLLDIWKKKISEQDARHKEIVAELIGDYKRMEKGFDDSISTLSDREASLEESVKLMRAMTK